MQPLAMFLGVIMGSAVAMAAGLILTLIVLLAVPEYAERISDEFLPLLRAIAGTLALAVLSALAFYGELRELRWRRLALIALAGSLSLAAWLNWPAE
jgi:putative flippase GtrA